MEKLKYKVDRVEDNIRYITVYTSDMQLVIELECLGGFLTNEEEIQNWLDDNGYGDTVFDFEKI